MRVDRKQTKINKYIKKETGNICKGTLDIEFDKIGQLV